LSPDATAADEAAASGEKVEREEDKKGQAFGVGSVFGEVAVLIRCERALTVCAAAADDAGGGARLAIIDREMYVSFSFSVSCSCSFSFSFFSDMVCTCYVLCYAVLLCACVCA
jgi:hypothetical protein